MQPLCTPGTQRVAPSVRFCGVSPKLERLERGRGCGHQDHQGVKAGMAPLLPPLHPSWWTWPIPCYVIPAAAGVPLKAGPPQTGDTWVCSAWSP